MDYHITIGTYGTRLHGGKRQWFDKCGSTKYLLEEGYFEAVYEYIGQQRTTR
ncbi:MAG: hypothetical protein FWE67_07720 [Planctomycetaceae bacterium]|nr:hypothetical protein [Planctomycetaceae bacterium]